MLQTLLISGTLALLAAAPGQAEVPIQADFDASQVLTDVPGWQPLSDCVCRYSMV